MLTASEAHKHTERAINRDALYAVNEIIYDKDLLKLFGWIQIKIDREIDKGLFAVEIFVVDVNAAFPFTKTDSTWVTLLRKLRYDVTIFPKRIDNIVNATYLIIW